MNGRILILAATALLVAACRGASEEAKQEDTAAPQQTALAPDVQLAVTVARAIDAAPASTDSILSANGLTKAGLDSLMYAIAADSAKSAAYTAARR
jgi:PBP1b-binding outer membrane lipoprotein LpoB